MSLYYKAEEVEQSIFFHTADLLNLQVDLIFTVRPRPPFPLTRKMKVDSPPKKGSERPKRGHLGAAGDCGACGNLREGLPQLGAGCTTPMWIP